MDYKDLRALAKEHGINTFQMGAEEISAALKEKGVEHDVPDLTPEPKKGNISWNPVQRLDVRNRKAGFRYRWCDKDQANIDRRLAEGWIFVNKTTGQPVEHERREHPEDGAPLDSAKTYRELVLMALPEEIGKARDAYVAERTNQQTVGLKADAERANQRAAGGTNPAKLHGEIVIR